ncbi:permease for cytosine/purines, uracil, thiamine, allantoin-domain-containing protein [Talaromyces proteolyticus]|uniref:Permease for cytosine/purines, uracil, thiamine, allantoin-domain-containing protein n=1 Tax=Talaromyces proteolyticus TaxID=1131652 RepID=A0AAD4KJY6_9EURO|nr:permease for cytosine/purines, uracil, thiamine, allantoin-domain-containing protein [Talaromyces proteolyticus]KAH8693304.1 permease for cytosine/purines, uracil, thiamine, allantoin-domain-containing protein [Talaromyces proteolyticus]
MLRSLVDALAVSPTAETKSSVWINNDIRPLPPSRRSWDRFSYISFWAINQICLSNFQIGSSLVAIGLSVWQAVIAIILGKIIVALVAIFNGYVGATWHIGFPVWSRVVWGIYGSYVALIQRVFFFLWQATQAWTGGLCVTAVLSAIFSGFQHLENTFPASSHLTTKDFIGWVIYNLITIPILWVPPEKANKPLVVMNAATPMTSSQLGWAIVQGVTTVIGNIAVGLTNQPDYSRFARKPGDQVFGQWFSIIFLGVLLPVFGCLTSSASLQIYGEAIWNPPNLALKWMDTDYNAKSRAAAFFAGEWI